jgi:hypothetical protein
MNEALLITECITQALHQDDERNAVRLAPLETQLHGSALCHCLCGAVIGAFPRGVVSGWRKAHCAHCEDAGRGGDARYFRLQRGWARLTIFGCGHEYRHGAEERREMETCPLCTGTCLWAEATPQLTRASRELLYTLARLDNATPEETV